MKLIIPAIVEPVPLSEYDERMSDDLMFVWVNPPRSKRIGLDTLKVKMISTWESLPAAEAEARPEIIAEIEAHNESLFEWWAEIFSQDAEQYTAADMRSISESDPTFWEWLQMRAWRVILEWRDEQKKKALTPPQPSPKE